MNKILIGLKIACISALVMLLANCASQSTSSEINTNSGAGVDSGSAQTIQNVNTGQVSNLEMSTQQIVLLKQYAPDTTQNNQQIFKRYRVNPTLETANQPVSTFSMDVDNGSYRLATKMLGSNNMPNQDGIRIEEFINALNYQYHPSDDLFAISAQAMPSPFRKGYHLLHVGLQTKILSDEQRNPSNIVLLADVSGSMARGSKLQLLKHAFTSLVSQLNDDDQVAVVSYNFDATIVLPATRAGNKRKIFAAINAMRADGGTNAEAGIKLAYQVADQMFQPGFNNRVILTSDGMANIGDVSPEGIVAQVKQSKDKGIFLTTVGVGTGMFNDYLLEQLANQGNGHYLYIADQQDIQRTFVDELTKQLQTVAKDAKVQLTFNSDVIDSYRQLGYDNRQLNEQDFTDANKDGGEIGAGHKVTVLYEIKLKQGTLNTSGDTQLAKLSVAYKKPLGQQVHYINKQIPATIVTDSVQAASPDTRLSYAVAAFGEKLRLSYWSRFYHYNDIVRLLSSLPQDYQRQAQVKALRRLITRAGLLDYRSDPFEPAYPKSQMNFNRVPLLD
ncbi:MAG: von Willebrand factor type A domain-containing protein [Algicola sp.]|nr:von Willebrand factor type A domain-containing protein [Algicola sp.]